MKEDNNVIQKLKLSKEGAEDLTFVRCDSEEIPEGYVPVPLPESSKEEFKSAFSAAIGAATPSAIVSQAANGLFRATVDPVKLAAFSDGTKSTILREGNKITGHAGFEPVSPKVFAPLFIFQVLSFFTGQYYMHRISKQLEALQESINELRKDLEIEKRASLISAYEELKQYAYSSVNTIDDLAQIQQIKTKMSVLYHFYLQKIQDCNDSFIDKLKKSKSGLLSEEIVLMEEGNLPYLRQMCVDACRLYIISKLVYLKALVSVSNNHKEYIPKIADILNGLESDKVYFINKIYASYFSRLQLFEESFKSNDSVVFGLERLLSQTVNRSKNIDVEELRTINKGNKYYQLLMKGATNVIEFVQSLDDERLDPVKRREKKASQHYQREMDSMKNEIDAILQPIHKKQEILIHIQDGEPRMYRLEKPE